MIDLLRPRLRDFQRAIAREIPCEPEGARADLEKMVLPSLLIQYMNWRDRLIPTRPREVFSWEGFLRHGVTRYHLPAVQKIRQRVIAGEDLRPFLSEKISRFGYVPHSLGKAGKHRGVEWRDKDYALNALGVHHLHLSDVIEADGWAKRTKPLLYVQFGRERAGFLMIGDHHSFDDGSLANALAEARALAGDTIKGVTPNKLSAKDQNRLARHGVTSFASFEDKTVLGPLLSSSGVSMLHTMQAQRMMRIIEAYEIVLDDPETSRPWFEVAGCEQPSKMEFSWGLNHCDIGVRESRTGIFFTLFQWCR